MPRDLGITLPGGEAALVHDSFDRVSTSVVLFSADFYERLFDRVPALRDLFPAEIAPQTRMLAQTLSWAVSRLNHGPELSAGLETLGASHRARGITRDHYAVFIEVLIETLADWTGPSWSARHETAWRSLLDSVADCMARGQSRAA